MQRKKVTTPDGQSFIITVPDGATNAEIQSRVEAHVRQKQGGSAKDTLAGVAGNYLDGILPGASGAVRGTREVLLNAIRAPFDASEDFEPAKAYSRGQAFQEARQKAAAQSHPRASNAAAWTGMGAGLFLPASKIAKGASLGQKALAGAKTAGLYGAASGAMSSKDETLLGRASDALSAGGVASLAGAAFPYVTKAASIAARPLRPFTDPVVRLAGRGLQTVGDYLPGAVGRSVAAEGAHLARDPALAAANAQLGREIGNTLHPQTRQPMRPQQVAEEVGKRQAVGVPAVAADLGDNLRSRFSKAVRTPGPALSSVRRHIEARQQQEAERAARHIAETLGPVGNIEQQAATLNAEARAAAAPLYELAHAQPIPYVRELQELTARPAGAESMRQAITMLRNEGEDALTQGRIELPGGGWTEGPVPSARAWDYVKTDLDGVVFGGQSPFASVEAGRDMRGATAIRSRLLELMDGDGSGPHTGLTPRSNGGPGTDRQETLRITRALGLPDAPPGLRSNLPVPRDTPGPWTGQRLHGEADSGGFEAARSFVPENGLNPYWKPARDAYAGPVQNRKAMELGQDMAKADATDAANRMADMTGSQVDFFRLGHRTGLADNALKAADRSDVVGRLAGSSMKRSALETVHGQDAASALYDRLGPEQDAFQTFRSIGGNTLHSPPDAAGREDAAASGIAQMATGSILAGVRNLAGSMIGRGKTGEAIDGHVAQILAERDPSALAAAMAALEHEGERQALVGQRATKATQQSSRFFGGVLGTNLIDPIEEGPRY